MKRTLQLLLLLGCLSLLVSASSATTLNFDNIGPQGTVVGASYISDPGGPLFTNDTTVLTCPFYNCSGYPPESSPSVAYSPASGLIDVVWTTANVSNIGFYLDNPLGGMSYVELDSHGNTIASGSLPQTIYGQSGVDVQLFDSGVHELEIFGTADFYVIDDLSYNAGGGVPEPASLFLLGTGLLGLGRVIRKKR
jgi:hypothetical protein